MRAIHSSTASNHPPKRFTAEIIRTGRLTAHKPAQKGSSIGSLHTLCPVLCLFPDNLFSSITSLSKLLASLHELKSPSRYNTVHIGPHDPTSTFINGPIFVIIVLGTIILLVCFNVLVTFE